MCILSISKHLFIIISLILAWSSTVAAEDNSYLQALEAEAEDSSNLNTPVIQKPNGVAPDQPLPDIDSLQSTERQKEFDKNLSKELPATSRAYHKLNIEDKIKVVDAYFSNNRSMTAATHLLFNLYFKSSHFSNKEEKM